MVAESLVVLEFVWVVVVVVIVMVLVLVVVLVLFLDHQVGFLVLLVVRLVLLAELFLLEVGLKDQEVVHHLLPTVVLLVVVLVLYQNKWLQLFLFS